MKEQIKAHLPNAKQRIIDLTTAILKIQNDPRKRYEVLHLTHLLDLNKLLVELAQK